jgi:hypothetical protein
VGRKYIKKFCEPQRLMPFLDCLDFNVTTSSITTYHRNPLESIPESGEIPDPALQSTAITDNTSSNSLCLATERSSKVETFKII